MPSPDQPASYQLAEKTSIFEIAAIERSRIVVSGTTQGGGLALAVAGLSTDVAVSLSDVPLLADIRPAIEITDAHPYAELVGYLRTRRTDLQSAFAIVDYVDGVNFAVRATASSLFSVGLMDPVCPPSTVFAAFNYYGGSAFGHTTATKVAAFNTWSSAPICCGPSGRDQWRTPDETSLNQSAK